MNGYQVEIQCFHKSDLISLTNENGVLYTDNDKLVNNGDILYITGYFPQMPILLAHYCAEGVDPASIQWELTISPVEYSNICKPVKFNGKGETWNIQMAIGTSLQGGNMHLVWRVNGKEGAIDFKILGGQPSPKNVHSAISYYMYSVPWCAKFVADAKSNNMQFTKDGLPLKTQDNGYGIFNLSKPTPTCLQLWNWQENVKEGVKRLGTFVTEGDKQVNQGDTVYITEDAEMPPLVALYCKPEVVPSSIQWVLKIMPTPKQDSKICTVSKPVTGTGNTWNITQAFGSNTQGGQVQLSGQVMGSKSDTTVFNIRGRNPDMSVVISLIKESTKLWYAEYVPFGEFWHKKRPLQFTSDGIPKESDNQDAGFGLFQLTKPAPNCLHLWNWKQNVKEGVKRLEKKTMEARQFMRKQRKQSADENSGSAFPVPDEQVGNCIFKDGTNRTIEDAVALKMYNGAYKNYCSWTWNVAVQSNEQL